MDKSSIVSGFRKQFSSKKTQEYTYLTFFFIMFSVFLIFAIRPSLTTAINLQQQEKDLTIVDNKYEELITSIVDNQASLERVRDQLPLLNQALPRSPEITKVVQDIEAAGSSSSLSFQNISIGETNLVQTDTNSVKPLVVNVQATGDFPSLIQFIQDLSSQRRLKTIKQLAITNGASTGVATGSGQLQFTMQIEGYYL